MPRSHADQQWHRHNIGRLLHNAIDHFDGRILEQMAATMGEAAMESLRQNLAKYGPE